MPLDLFGFGRFRRVGAFGVVSAHARARPRTSRAHGPRTSAHVRARARARPRTSAHNRACPGVVLPNRGGSYVLCVFFVDLTQSAVISDETMRNLQVRDMLLHKNRKTARCARKRTQVK